VGDHLDWFVKNALPASYTDEAKARGISPHQLLRERIENAPVGESGLLCLDWFGGNRSPLKDLELTGAIFGLTLRTRPEEIYRAMIEGSVFGAKLIIDNFENNGIYANKILASGGIAEKDGMTMQIFADVLGREITVPSVKNSAARGGAIYAAVAAGIYENINAAVDALGVGEGKTYYPRPENTEAYKALYEEYLALYRQYGEGDSRLLRGLKKARA
jgi:L-ribulokinase